MVGYKKPSNTVLVAGQPIVQELICKTVTNCNPGVLVTRDTDDDHFKACGATDMPLGFLDVNETVGIGDTYVADDVGKVLSGPVAVRAILANGENVTKGDLLVQAANGRLAKASTLQVASGATGVTSSAANGDIITGHYGDTPLVARAEETVDATGGEQAIVVRSLL
jgi:hypothetical protein